MPKKFSQEIFEDVSNLLGAKIGEKEKKEITIPAKFFQDNNLRLKAPISGQLVLRKNKESIIADFIIKSKGELVCERCLENFLYKIDFHFSQNYLLFRKNQGQKEERTMYVLPNQKIEIFEPIRQEILLNLPFKILCKKNCKGLCSECGENLNQKECRCKKNKF